MTTGRILIVTGTSGSGKSTACELFARRSDEFWLLYGIDHFMAGTFPAKYGHHGPLAREGVYAHPVDPARPDGALRWSFGPYGTRAFAALHEWVAATARTGVNIVLDHLMLVDPPILQDAVWRMAGLPVTLVSLRPTYEVLLERIASRKMDKKMPTDLLGDDAIRKIVDRLDRLRPWFYEASYANDIVDLEIDTVANGPDDVVTQIQQLMAESTHTAFERLRERWPDPRASAD